MKHRVLQTQLRGFTLIELLVVIAVIGVLATVVLASLSSARNKANDKAIMADMITIRSQAIIYHDIGGAGSYGPGSEYFDSCTGGMFGADSIIVRALNKIKAFKGPDYVVCYSTPSTFVVAAKLMSTNDYFCVDSTGAGKVVLGSNAGNGLYGGSGTVITGAGICQ